MRRWLKCPFQFLAAVIQINLSGLFALVRPNNNRRLTIIKIVLVQDARSKPSIVIEQTAPDRFPRKFSWKILTSVQQYFANNDNIMKGRSSRLQFQVGLSDSV